jgi:hypothetical protein
MADEGRSAEWDEVGRRFGELGHKLQEAWSESRSEPTATATEAETAENGRGVAAALEDLKTSITHTVSDPEVRAAVGSATEGFADALAANLRQLADWIDHRPTGTSGGGETVTTDKPDI